MFKFKLVTLSGKKFDGEVYEVSLPTRDGQIGVLSHHMPLFSVIKHGVIMVRKNQKDSDNLREYFATNGGIIDVANNELKVLVDEADHADEINKVEAEAAYQRAKKMRAEAKDLVSIEKAQEIIDRQTVRLAVANLKHRHRKN